MKNKSWIDLLFVSIKGGKFLIDTIDASLCLNPHSIHHQFQSHKTPKSILNLFTLIDFH